MSTKNTQVSKPKTKTNKQTNKNGPKYEMVSCPFHTAFAGG